MSRRWMERLFLAVGLGLLVPGLVVALLMGAVASVVRGRSPRAWLRLVRATVHRWLRLLMGGLDPLREVWWGELALERPAAIAHYVALIEVFNLVNLAAGGVRPGGTPARILAIKLAHFGDALHVVPMLNSLQKQTAAKVDLLLGPWCEWLGRRIPAVHERLVYAPRLELFSRGSRKGCRSFAGDIAFMLSLRRRRYDIVVSTSTTRMVELCLIYATGTPLWIGAASEAHLFPGPGEARTVPYDTRRYEADRIGDLLSLLSLAPSKADLEYAVAADERKYAEDLLAGLGLSPGSPYVIVSPGAGWPGKQWPAGHFAALADFAAGRTHAAILLVGSPEELALADEVGRSMRHPFFNVAGKTSIPQLAALIGQSVLFMGNDSGPMHLAAALGVPTLVFFGPTRAEQWAPRGVQHVALQARSDCDGCWYWHQNARCVHENRCMKAITLEQAREAVVSLLSRLSATKFENRKAAAHDVV